MAGLHSDLNFFSLGACALLALSIISLWLPRWPRAWLSLFLASLVFALSSGLVSGLGLSFLLLGMVCVHALVRLERARTPPRRSRRLQSVLVLCFSFIAIGIATAWLPGFAKLTLSDAVQLSEGAAPFSLTLNYGKAAVGVLILGLGARLIKSRREWAALPRPVLHIALLTIAAVAALSVTLGYTRFEPKWSSLFFAWALGKLLFTCVAEEAFFRGFVQARLARWLAPREQGAVWAWLIASLLFGVAHAGGGAGMVLLATVAGLGYGWAYLKTGSIEAAVLVHFLLNVFHFLFLSYPRLL